MSDQCYGAPFFCMSKKCHALQLTSAFGGLTDTLRPVEKNWMRNTHVHISVTNLTITEHESPLVREVLAAELMNKYKSRCL